MRADWLIWFTKRHYNAKVLSIAGLAVIACFRLQLRHEIMMSTPMRLLSFGGTSQSASIMG